MSAGPRVLFFTRYEWKGPSSRYRTLQYLPRLEELGFETEVHPLFPNRYIDGIVEGHGKPVFPAVQAYLGRIWDLVRARDADVVVIEKELFPYLPAIFERLLAALPIPYVVDFDDAVYHRYDRSTNPIARRLLSGKIPRVVRGASLVTVGNRYLAAYAENAGAERVEVIPTVVDLTRYPVQQPPEDQPFTVGWIGSPTTTRHLELTTQAMGQLSQEIPLRLILVGAGEIDLPAGLEVERRPWAEDREVEDLLEFDVGIAPLHDAPFERGKCGLKIVQYMAAGRPVVASPVSAQATLVEDGETGLLASEPDEWLDALRALAASPSRRRKMGERGRHLAEERYSLDVTAPRLARLFEEQAQAGGRTGRQAPQTPSP